MNMLKGDKTLEERQRAAKGSDIEAMTIDKTVTFQSIGGLHHHVKALREMIVFPLMCVKTRNDALVEVEAH